MAKSIVIPSNPADLKAIKDAIKEASDSLVQIEAEQDQIKAIIDMVAEKYELPKNFVRRMIKVFHKSTYDKETTSFEDWVELYKAVIK